MLILIRVRSILAAGKICTALALGVAPIALLAPGSDKAFSQTGTWTVATPPLFTAIDLNPSGFNESWASGISDGEQVGDGSGPATGGQTHALVWRGSAARLVDLHPRGFVQSQALGTSGGQQVGYGSGPATGGQTHALLWRGSASNVVDLHPSGFYDSEAIGISGGQQVGWGWPQGPSEGGEALSWHGTVASVVDLHPGKFNGSRAMSNSGEEQVGWGVPGAYSVGPFHALLWRGSAGSEVDLHPSGFNGSWAMANSGGEQVGYGSLGRNLGYEADSGPFHALSWRGSAASALDLHPKEFTNSEALGTNGEEQVGWGAGAATGNIRHALLWRGIAASALDLHAFLPPGFVGSIASGIDSTGDIAGVAWGPASENRNHAFLWTRKAQKSGNHPDQHTITLGPAWAQYLIGELSPQHRRAIHVVSEGERANAP